MHSLSSYIVFIFSINIAISSRCPQLALWAKYIDPLIKILLLFIISSSILGQFLWIFYPSALFYTKNIIPLSVNG